MKEDVLFPQQYINTPFAYTKFAKNLSLLQQSVLNKVSEHLQSYISRYFGSDLKNSKDVPRPLFLAAEKKNGMPEFVMSYAELGVSINNYSVARAAIQEVLSLTVDAPGKDKDGNPAIVKYNIFTKANISSSESNGVAFSLNSEVVDYVFDMSQGYVRHPADIARIGRVERMPMIYYYLFKKSERWKNRTVRLTVPEIKDYLGMRGNITSGNESRAGRPTKDGEIKEAYPKFSKFNTMVLARSVDDINRLKQDGLLDVCVSYEPIYSGKRKVGNPTYIEFTIYDTIGEMQQAILQRQQKQQINLFADTQGFKPGEKEWQQLVSMLGGELGEELRKVEFVSFDGKGIILKACREQCQKVEGCLSDDVIAHVKKCSMQVFGKIIAWNYSLSDK